MTDEELEQALAEARKAGDLDEARRLTTALMCRAEDSRGDFDNVSLRWREDLAELCVEAGDLAEAEQHYEYLVRHSAPMYGADHHRTRRRQADLERIRAMRRGGGAAGPSRPMDPAQQRATFFLLLLIIGLAFGSLVWNTVGKEQVRRAALEEGSPEWVKQARLDRNVALHRLPGGGTGWWKTARERILFEREHGDAGSLRQACRTILQDLRTPVSGKEERGLVHLLAIELIEKAPAEKWDEVLEDLRRMREALGHPSSWPKGMEGPIQHVERALDRGRQVFARRFPRSSGEGARLPRADRLTPVQPLLEKADGLAAEGDWREVEARLREAEEGLPGPFRDPVFSLERHIDRKLAWALAGQGRYSEAYASLARARDANTVTKEEIYYSGAGPGFHHEDPGRDEADMKSLAILEQARDCLDELRSAGR